MFGDSDKTLCYPADRRNRKAIVLAALCFAVAAPVVYADVNVELRPASQIIAIGDIVNVGIYVVSDDATDQLISSAEIIFTWETSMLELLGKDDGGGAALMSSSFPAGDPYNLNEVVPPADGDGLYVAVAPPGNPVAATPEGTLLTTLQFEALAATAATAVDVPATGGSPEGATAVFDGTNPGLDVTGALSGASIEILSGPTLRLTVDTGSGDVDPGDLIEVSLWMLGLGSEEAAGFQAFLTFDSTKLIFIAGNYSAEPFGLEIIEPIVAVGEDIDLAAGIDVAFGQPPTSSNSNLVDLTFEVIQPECAFAVTFREHQPPTRLTDGVGNEILPLDLIGFPTGAPDPDVNDDGVVNVVDLLILLGAWGPCPMPPDACPADVNCDGVVDILDLLALIAAWTV